MELDYLYSEGDVGDLDLLFRESMKVVSVNCSLTQPSVITPPHHSRVARMNEWEMDIRRRPDEDPSSGGFHP